MLAADSHGSLDDILYLEHVAVRDDARKYFRSIALISRSSIGRTLLRFRQFPTTPEPNCCY